MITDPDLLYNRHRLSAFQIERHFGLPGAVAMNAQSLAEDHFQTLDAFFEIADALAAHQIPFIPIKGPLLSDLIYGNAAARRFYDLDFLIDPQDIERALAVAQARGYAPQDQVPSDALGWARLFAADHHFLCRHAGSKTDVELHWRLFPRYTFPGKPFRDLYRTETVPHGLAGRQFRKLSNEMEFVFILAHGSKHGWFRLKWLVDVNDYLRAVTLDLAKVEHLLSRHGMMRMASLYNAMARQFIPDAALLPFTSRRPSHLLRRAAGRAIHAPVSRNTAKAPFLKRLIEVHDEVYLDLLLTPNPSTAGRFVFHLPRIALMKAWRYLRARLPGTAGRSSLTVTATKGL